jgi:hypothetical protein
MTDHISCARERKFHACRVLKGSGVLKEEGRKKERKKEIG